MSLNLNAVMDAIGVRLATISGLRVYDYPADKVAVPAVVVGFPDRITYDTTMAGGVHSLTMRVSVLVGGVFDRTSRDALSDYVDTTGTASVKAALDGTLDGTVKDTRVAFGDFVSHEIGGIAYPAVVFNLEVFV